MTARKRVIKSKTSPTLKSHGIILASTTNVNKPISIGVDKIICGDCCSVLPMMQSDKVDLIMTSPPYADRRSKVYGGVKPGNYVEWFIPIAKELKRVLKPSGSFVLNIKEIAVNGERHPYVIELILEMRKMGWLWIDEYIWHKKNSYPGKWPNRFRDAWERCLHFTKQRHFAMFQENVMVPMGDWRNTRLNHLSETDRIRDNSRVDSGFGKKIENWVGREKAYPSNVIHIATECGNKGHSAAFPVTLPEWFVKLFTKEDDIVLDPFMGSGSTAIACLKNDRHYYGIDNNQEYCEKALIRIEEYLRTKNR